MTELHITWVDIAVAVILILSIWMAIARGFVRETLSIFAWAAAAFATLYFGRYAAAALAPHAPKMVAQVLGYAGVFLLVLIPLALIAAGISRQIHASPMGGLDRMLGALFGIVRGLVAIAVLYILYSLVIAVPVQAHWMKDARTLPLIQKSASTLLSLLPEHDANYVMQRAKSGDTTETAVQRPMKDAGDMASTQRRAKASQPKVLHKSYGADDRHRLNRVIEATGHGQ
jgi:membrane protein required for colicin V production